MNCVFTPRLVQADRLSRDLEDWTRHPALPLPGPLTVEGLCEQGGGGHKAHQLGAAQPLLQGQALQEQMQR